MEIEQDLKNIFANFKNLNNPDIDTFIDDILTFFKYKDIRYYDISKKTIYKDNNPYLITLEGGPDTLFLNLIKSNKNIKYGLKISRKIHNNCINIKFFDNESIIYKFDIRENNIRNDIKCFNNLRNIVK